MWDFMKKSLNRRGYFQATSYVFNLFLGKPELSSQSQTCISQMFLKSGGLGIGNIDQQLESIRFSRQTAQNWYFRADGLTGCGRDVLCGGLVSCQQVWTDFQSTAVKQNFARWPSWPESIRFSCQTAQRWYFGAGGLTGCGRDVLYCGQVLCQQAWTDFQSTAVKQNFARWPGWPEKYQ